MCMMKTPFPIQFYKITILDSTELSVQIKKNQLQKGQENGSSISSG